MPPGLYDDLLAVPPTARPSTPGPYDDLLAVPPTARPSAPPATSPGPYDDLLSIPPVPDLGLGESAINAVARGGGGIIRNMLGGTLQALDPITPLGQIKRSLAQMGAPVENIPTPNEFLGEKFQGWGEAIQEKFPASRSTQDFKLKDALDLTNIGRTGRFAMESGLEQVPNLAAQIVAAIASGGSSALAQLAAFAAPAVAEAGGGTFLDAERDLTAQGLSPQDAEGRALLEGGLVGAASGALEAIPGSEMLGGAGRSILRRIVGSAVAEAGTEASQSLVSDAGEFGVRGNENAFEGSLERAGLSALASLGPGALGGYAGGRVNAKESGPTGGDVPATVEELLAAIGVDTGRFDAPEPDSPDQTPSPAPGPEPTEDFDLDQILADGQPLPTSRPGIEDALRAAGPDSPFARLLAATRAGIDVPTTPSGRFEGIPYAPTPEPPAQAPPEPVQPPPAAPQGQVSPWFRDSPPTPPVAPQNDPAEPKGGDIPPPLPAQRFNPIRGLEGLEGLKQAEPGGEAGGVRKTTDKEPWEMTYVELRNEGLPGQENVKTPQDVKARAEILRALYPEFTDTERPDTSNDYAYGIWRMANVGDELHRLPLNDLAKRHKALIDKAINDGKPIPPEVIADYPDIAARYKTPDPTIRQSRTVQPDPQPAPTVAKSATVQPAPVEGAGVSPLPVPPSRTSVESPTTPAPSIEASSTPPTPPTEPQAPPAAPDDAPEPGTFEPRNARARQVRQRMGLELANSPEKKAWGESLDKAQKRGLIESAPDIVRDVNDGKKRILDDEESMAVAHRMADLALRHEELESKASAETATEEDREDFEAQRIQLEQDYELAQSAFERAGTELGRSLSIRRVALKRDESLIGLTRRAKVLKRKFAGPKAEMTPDESRRMEIASRELAETNRKLDKVQRERDDLEAELTLARSSAPRPGRRGAKPESESSPQKRVEKARAVVVELLKKGCPV